MKKTLKRPDGTEETYEGTPEEIVEMERRIAEGGPVPKKDPKKGRKTLTDQVRRLEEDMRGLRRRIEEMPIVPQITFPICPRPHADEPQPWVHPWTSPHITWEAVPTIPSPEIICGGTSRFRDIVMKG